MRPSRVGVKGGWSSFGLDDRIAPGGVTLGRDRRPIGPFASDLDPALSCTIDEAVWLVKLGRIRRPISPSESRSRELDSACGWAKPGKARRPTIPFDAGFGDLELGRSWMGPLPGRGLMPMISRSAHLSDTRPTFDGRSLRKDGVDWSRGPGLGGVWGRWCSIPGVRY